MKFVVPDNIKGTRNVYLSLQRQSFLSLDLMLYITNILYLLSSVVS
jgi:hypothetical protein